MLGTEKRNADKATLFFLKLALHTSIVFTLFLVLQRCRVNGNQIIGFIENMRLLNIEWPTFGIASSQP